MRRLVGAVHVVPFLFAGGATLCTIPRGCNIIRNLKWRIIPAKFGACRGNFLITQRRTMSAGCALLVWRTKANDCLATNQCRSITVGHCCINRFCNSSTIVSVYIINNLPAISIETLRRVIGEPGVGFAIDGYAIVIVQTYEFTQLQRASQRTGLVRNAFHQAAVAEKNPGAVVDNIVIVTIKGSCQHPFCQRHTDSVADTLAKRASGRFDGKIGVPLRMARGTVAKLPEIADFIDAQRVTRQMQQAVMQH